MVSWQPTLCGNGSISLFPWAEPLWGPSNPGDHLLCVLWISCPKVINSFLKFDRKWNPMCNYRLPAGGRALASPALLCVCGQCPLGRRGRTQELRQEGGRPGLHGAGCKGGGDSAQDCEPTGPSASQRGASSKETRAASREGGEPNYKITIETVM